MKSLANAKKDTMIGIGVLRRGRLSVYGGVVGVRSLFKENV